MKLSKERIDDESLQGLIDMRRERVEYCKAEGLRASLILNEAMLSALTELLERRERDKQEPVAYMVGGYTLLHAHDPKVDEYLNRATPLYTAPPAPVVLPDAFPCGGAKDDYHDGYQDGWNACRAAMLLSFGNSEQLEPVSQTYTLRDGLAAIRKLGPIDAEKIQAERDALNSPAAPDGWVKCSERMPEDAQWCVVNTEYGYYVQCWSHGQGWLGDDVSIPNCDVTHWMPLPAAPKQESE